MAKNPEANLLDFIPHRQVPWESDDAGLIDLITPKFKSQWMQKCFGRFGKSPSVRIHLDDFGSSVWKLCDGQKTIFEIGSGLKNEFGESVEPVFERLTAFVRLLKYHRTLSLLHSNHS